MVTNKGHHSNDEVILAEQRGNMTMLVYPCVVQDSGNEDKVEILSQDVLTQVSAQNKCQRQENTLQKLYHVTSTLSPHMVHSYYKRPAKKDASRCFCLPVTFPDFPFFLFFGCGSSSESLALLFPSRSCSSAACIKSLTK